ncbi:DNA repair protein XRCC3 homolog [Spinacia oleracea]|uniref:DNA repair protein XRCC3 homolog n=1 Tax=Spinacia oleracea TaxID=3562 RepID=A0ABM3RIA9_SPIOL|nr:DNA repair protein XRCC3 homolog [Spinacia oleracea]
MNHQLDKKLQQGNAIDSITLGGVSVGEVTELCGENATGKTQLVLQASIACQLRPSLGGMHIRVIVVDSIASICTSHFENIVDGLESRSQLLRAIGYGLQSIAATYNVAVIVVNNVVDVFPSDRDSSTHFMMSSGRKVRPTLGMGWARNIETRLFFTKTLNPSTQMFGRLCSILLSTTLELNACRFKITEQGVPDA